MSTTATIWAAAAAAATLRHHVVPAVAGGSLDLGLSPPDSLLLLVLECFHAVIFTLGRA
eukprot:COSAG05_NODE_155_length_15704_cov_84.777315_9_plen_59_part_00